MARLTRWDARLVLPEPDRVLARAGCPPSAGRGLVRNAQAALVILSERSGPAALSSTSSIEIRDDEAVHMGGIVLRSRDLARMLKNSQKATVFLVTLGGGPGESVQRLQEKGEHALAHMLDAAASAMVEKCAGLLQETLSGEMEDHGTSMRYAPGYGDLGLECQADILEFLQGSRLNVAFRRTSYMLEPTKSTTGVMGWHRLGS